MEPSLPAPDVAAFGRAVLGLGVLLGIAVACSADRRRIPWRLVGAGLALQALIGVAVLKVPLFHAALKLLADFFVAVLDFSFAGAAFLFGGLVEDKTRFGFIFAFNVLPTIIFFAALTSALYYLGVLQRVVYGFAWLMSKTMRLSGAESLSASANIFVGQTEAPLLIKPYLERMTRSEILCVMIGGMATIAGGVLAAYVGMLGGDDEQLRRFFARHLLTASLLSAPAAVVVAKILLPETEEVSREVLFPRQRAGSNLLDALANGTADGLKLAFNVAAMLIVFTALIALLNYTLAHGLGGWTGLNERIAAATGGRYAAFDLPLLFGLLFAPLAWVIGVPTADLMVAGQLLGEKTVINEFFAFASLERLKLAGTVTDPATLVLLAYALSGFSNFASIGIQIGGISALAPNQRPVLAALGLRALLGGTLACLMTACFARVLM